jgi:hypothetical protein
MKFNALNQELQEFRSSGVRTILAGKNALEVKQVSLDSLKPGVGDLDNDDEKENDHELKASTQDDRIL